MQTIHNTLSSILIALAQIISQKDEHCWVGELNGLRGVCSLILFINSHLYHVYIHFFCTVSFYMNFMLLFVTGWFPAKFVEILDERSKEVRKQLIFKVFLYLICPAAVCHSVPSMWYLSFFSLCVSIPVHRMITHSVLNIDWCSRLSPVFISRWWFCDRGSDRPGQGHTVSGPKGHFSAWSQETIYFGRSLSSLVIHRRGRRASVFLNSTWSHIAIFFLYKLHLHHSLFSGFLSGGQ